VASESPNKVLQKTKTAIVKFGIFLSHNGLLPIYGLLPVMTGGFGF
jgi:hypothetical protein